MPLKILSQNHECPSCGYKWTSTKPLDPVDWDGFEDEVRSPFIKGGSFGAGIGAGCASLIIVMVLFTFAVHFIFWLIGVEMPNN